MKLVDIVTKRGISVFQNEIKEDDLLKKIGVKWGSHYGVWTPDLNDVRPEYKFLLDDLLRGIRREAWTLGFATDADWSYANKVWEKAALEALKGTSLSSVIDTVIEELKKYKSGGHIGQLNEDAVRESLFNSLKRSWEILNKAWPAGRGGGAQQILQD
ncbi:MAG: hypothetical protein N2578_00700 [Bdellovibrionaceae bacterium]|nr:hypothetical protein [Pseudobdellovibrionaceae bacterium]